MALPSILYPVDGTGDPVNSDQISGWGIGTFAGDVRGAAQAPVYQIIIGLFPAGYRVWNYTDEDIRDGEFAALQTAAGTAISS